MQFLAILYRLRNLILCIIGCSWLAMRNFMANTKNVYSSFLFDCDNDEYHPTYIYYIACFCTDSLINMWLSGYDASWLVNFLHNCITDYRRLRMSILEVLLSVGSVTSMWILQCSFLTKPRVNMTTQVENECKLSFHC